MMNLTTIIMVVMSQMSGEAMKVSSLRLKGCKDLLYKTVGTTELLCMRNKVEGL